VITMDNIKVGKLLLALRIEKNMTQKEIADILNLSDRTISKWERGLGFPDVSLLNELSRIYGVNIEKLLSGDLDPNENNYGGSMKKTKFYVCSTCGNVMFSSSESDISCCGRKISALATEKNKEHHAMSIEKIENDYYITIDHEMSKTHYISFVAFVGYDRALLVKLYPEQNAELRIPQMPGNQIYACCNKHGLWEHRI